MKRKQKSATRILTLLLAFSMTASVFGTTPAYAMESATMNIEAAGQEAAQSEIQSETEDVQEEVKEEKSTGTLSIYEDASGNSVKDDEKEPEDNNGNPEQPRAPANELPVTDEGSSTASTVGTEQADTFAVTISGIEHAEASASVDMAAEGESVTITVTPEEGYQVQSFCAEMEDGTELEYSSEADEQNGTVLYTFIMPAGAVTVDIVMEASQAEAAVAGIGENIEFAFDQTAYQLGDTVTAVLTPRSGYDVDLESIVITDAAGTVIEYQLSGPDENGAVTLTFPAAETDMTVEAEASPWPRYHVAVTTEALDAASSVFIASVEPQDLYEGVEVTVSVDYTGDQIWTATVTYGEDDTDLDFSVSSSGVTFIMPSADVNVVLSEREDQNLGDLSADDSSIAGDWQGNTSSTEKEYEPDVELSKSARWTDIEDGYAELTITEKDTSDYSNIPVDYIIILDRTRTMSLSNMTWEQGGYPDIVNENSPCINPNHYYYKGGISLSLVDYYTGFDSSSGVWFDDLSGGASSWTKRHYNASGQQISVSYGSGCQDRLTMAKQAVYELMDQIAEDNADVPSGKIKSRVAFWSFADGTYYGGYDPYRVRGLYNYTPWTENYASVKTAVSNVKSLKINENTYHVQADVVPAFQLRNYYYLRSTDPNKYIEGTWFVAKDRKEVSNYPKRHIQNGVNKNNATNYKYKKLVRIMKHIKNNMVEDKRADGNKITSFLVECLVYQIPNNIITGYYTWTETVRQAIIFLYNEIEAGRHKEWCEVSGMLYLFRERKWTDLDAEQWLCDAWNYLECGE